MPFGGRRYGRYRRRFRRRRPRMRVSGHRRRYRSRYRGSTKRLARKAYRLARTNRPELKFGTVQYTDENMVAASVHTLSLTGTVQGLDDGQRIGRKITPRRFICNYNIRRVEQEDQPSYSAVRVMIVRWLGDGQPAVQNILSDPARADSTLLVSRKEAGFVTPFNVLYDRVHYMGPRPAVSTITLADTYTKPQAGNFPWPCLTRGKVNMHFPGAPRTVYDSTGATLPSYGGLFMKFIPVYGDVIVRLDGRIYYTDA